MCSFQYFADYTRVVPAKRCIMAWATRDDSDQTGQHSCSPILVFSAYMSGLLITMTLYMKTNAYISWHCIRKGRTAQWHYFPQRALILFRQITSFITVIRLYFYLIVIKLWHMATLRRNETKLRFYASII